MRKKFVESFDVTNFQVENSNSVTENNSEDGVIVWIDAIHAMTTRNYTTYTAQELKGDSTKKTGQYSWTYPYEAPVLTHHNQRTGEPIGRVITATFSSSSQAGPPVIRLKCRIADPEAVQKVKDGRYKTVSIGAYAEHAYCSICGTDWIEEGNCMHWPGREYGKEEKEVAHLILGDIYFVEISFVNVPSDKFAQVTSIVGDAEEPEKSKGEPVKEKKENTQGGLPMTLEKQLENLQEKLGLKEEKLEVYETKISNLETKVSTLEEQNGLLSEEKEILEGKLENLNQEIEKLVQENAELKKNQKKVLAEKVVDLKIQLGKLKEEDREEKVLEHIKRTEESLNDSLIDLQEEKKLLSKEEEGEEILEAGQVTNPGLHSSNEENVVTESDDSLSNEDYTDVDLKINAML